MRKPAEFREAIRTGIRGKSPSLMVHVAPANGVEADQPPALVGFVVPKSVGNAVVRNRVERQLRHLFRARVEMIPPGTHIVCRVFPPAAGASSADLERHLDQALGRAGL